MDQHSKLRAVYIAATILSSKIELAKIVAHNIKSPMLALEMTLPSLCAQESNAAKIASLALEEIKSLASELKRASEGEGGGLSNLKFEVVSVKEIIGSLIEQKKFEHANSSVSLSGQSINDSRVRANSKTLRSVFSNIINNAVESYADLTGGVLVEIEKAGDYVEIKFRDEGSGIDKALIGALGVDSVSTKPGTGRGVGLMHARSAIESFGGRLRIESSRGAGTTVHVSLPSA